MKLSVRSDIIVLALCETDARGFAQIAQLVEQRTENPRVTGSIPVLGTKALKSDDFKAFFLYFSLNNITIRIIMRINWEDSHGYSRN